MGIDSIDVRDEGHVEHLDHDEWFAVCGLCDWSDESAYRHIDSAALLLDHITVHVRR